MPALVVRRPDVQSFLPYPDFARSARVLDDRRLGKQRVEALQIYRALTREKYGWRNHPAVLMWRSYEEALIAYGIAMCDEWRRRGRNDTVRDTLIEEWGSEPRTQRELRAAGALPPWLGRRDLHVSHRSALLRKDPGWYGAHFGELTIEGGYVWPVRSR